MKILQYPDPILLTPSVPVSIEEGAQIAKQLRKAATLQKWGVCVGMAAPQIGINKRVFIVLKLPYVKGHPEYQTFINPEIIWTPKHRKTHLEGCYSLDIERYDYQVSRPASVKLRWRDEDSTDYDSGQPLSYREAKYHGIVAQIIQHEFDHLEGKLCNRNEI